MLERKIAVKVNSEEAGAISLTPVRAREITLGELLEWIVSVTGKDAERVEAVLSRGSMVRSLSRIRWQAFTLGPELAEALRAVPEDNPALAFAPSRLRDMVLRCGGETFVVSAETARKRRLLHGRSLLDALMERGDALDYVRYDYDVRCDSYRLRRLPGREQWRFLADRALRKRLAAGGLSEVLLRATR